MLHRASCYSPGSVAHNNINKHWTCYFFFFFQLSDILGVSDQSGLTSVQQASLQQLIVSSLPGSSSPRQLDQPLHGEGTCYHHIHCLPWETNTTCTSGVDTQLPLSTRILHVQLSNWLLFIGEQQNVLLENKAHHSNIIWILRDQFTTCRPLAFTFDCFLKFLPRGPQGRGHMLVWAVMRP